MFSKFQFHKMSVTFVILLSLLTQAHNFVLTAQEGESSKLEIANFGRNATAEPILLMEDFLIEGDPDYDVNDDGDDDGDFVDESTNDNIKANEINEANDFLDGRIVGGTAVSIRQFPYQVSLQYKKAHICGGSIVAPNLVITAAHCIERPNNPNLYRVRVGSSQHQHGGQLIAVRRIKAHELYSTTTLDNDVAIIVLAVRLKFNDNIKAVRVAKQTDVVPSKKQLFISGWGLTSETGTVAPVLRFATVRLLNEGTCFQNYKSFTRITPRMFCAGTGSGGRDSCQGDSGGPLVSFVSGKPKLFGVVSWGVGCAQKSYPGVYAKVSALRSWINKKVLELRKSI